MILHPDERSARISVVFGRYGNMLYKMSYLLLCNKSDAEDAVQEAFVRYLRKPREFESAEHEKAWFIHVARNVCRDRQRFRFRHKAVSLDAAEPYAAMAENTDTLRELLSLPPKCKTPLYLYYYEGYSVKEIARMLKSNESTVKSWLLRGRQQLKIELQERRFDNETGRLDPYDRRNYAQPSSAGEGAGTAQPFSAEAGKPFEARAVAVRGRGGRSAGAAERRGSR
jgi:RNA polymerase sigma-70 factor (ECF subfamily)